jgi:DNA polymerase-1
MRLIFDIETNGLLDACTKVHCVVTHDLDSGEKLSFSSSPRSRPLHEVAAYLRRATELIGHNIIDFDLPALKKLIGFEPSLGTRITDTLVVARLVWPDTKEQDSKLVKALKMPSTLMGLHKLEAWGYRLGLQKGDYAKEMKAQGLDPWAEFNERMLDYCILDVDVNTALWERIQKRAPAVRAVDLEHAVYRYCKQQTEFGVAFNERSAVELFATLSQEATGIQRELKQVFGWWYQPAKVFTPKRDNRKEGYLAGAPFTRIVPVEFNPSSRDHIARCFKTRYGWEPTQFTTGGKAAIDESVLELLPFPEAKLLNRYLVVQKLVGMVATGKNAWLKLCRNGRIHGRLTTNGAVTGRATHSSPNLGQVPRVGSPFGLECRSLFIATPGWTLVGADASGLELRCLAHFMALYDGGAYAEIVLHGDIHWATVLALGLVPPGTVRDKHNKKHDDVRNIAKTFIYAFLYGAGDAKIGSIVGKGPKMGRTLKKRFMAGLPALGRLVEKVAEKVNESKTLKGLDGRVLHVRSAHSALNTLLQSAGAVIMKQAMVNLHEACAAKGWVHGKDYRQVLWVHDEFQVECRPEIADALGSTMVDAIRKVTADFNFRCPLDGEFKVGSNWAETH